MSESASLSCAPRAPEDGAGPYQFAPGSPTMYTETGPNSEGRIWEIRPCREHGFLGYAILKSPFQGDRWMPCVQSAERRIQRRVDAGEM